MQSKIISITSVPDFGPSFSRSGIQPFWQIQSHMAEA